LGKVCGDGLFKYNLACDSGACNYKSAPCRPLCSQVLSVRSRDSVLHRVGTPDDAELRLLQVLDSLRAGIREASYASQNDRKRKALC